MFFQKKFNVEHKPTEFYDLMQFHLYGCGGRAVADPEYAVNLIIQKQ